MAYLRALAFLAALSFSLIFIAPIQWLARRFDSPLHRRIQVGFCRTFCAIIGIDVAVHGRIAGSSPRLIIANHVSWTDIIVLASLHPLVFLAKSEVASWPALGFLARLQGAIFVERGNRRAIPRVNEALTREMRRGRDIVVFAEGTSSDGSLVLKFNASHLVAPRDGGGPEATLAPVAIAYTEPGARAPADVGWYGDMTFIPHLWSLMKRGGVECHVLYGEAIAPDIGDRKAIAAATQASVQRMLQSVRG